MISPIGYQQKLDMTAQNPKKIIYVIIDGCIIVLISS